MRFRTKVFLFLLLSLSIIIYALSRSSREGKPWKIGKRPKVEEYNHTPIRKSPPVVARLLGGLGNQLFQYAAAYSIAKKRNSDIYMCVYEKYTVLTEDVEAQRSERHMYSLNQFNVPQNKLLFKYPPASYIWNPYRYDEYECGIDYYLNDEKVETLIVHELHVLQQDLPDDKVLQVEDYFESEIFFAADKSDILNIFQPTFDTRPIEQLKLLISSTENIVSVHIRRGDFTRENDFRLISLSYQREAMQLIKQKLQTDNVTFFVFTDDVDYVKNHLRDGNHEADKIIYMSDHTEGNTLYDFVLMSLCQHNIITNSTFSWWAAYLNKNIAKIVIGPLPKYKSEWILTHFTLNHTTTDLFINIIQNHRIIYDTASKDFKNVNKKDDEWEKIAKESRMTVDGAKKRYFSLRQKYCREKKKEVMCARTKQTFRPWVFFDRLNFLGDFIKPRRTYTSDVDGIDSMNLGDDYTDGDTPNDSTSGLMGDKNTGHSTVQRRRLNDLTDEEYRNVMLFGERISLAEEDAMMEEGLNFKDTEDLAADDYEILAEIEVGQQHVPDLMIDIQDQIIEANARTSDTLSPHSEALMDRATLSIDEQLQYVEIPSSGNGLHPVDSDRSQSLSVSTCNATVEKGQSSLVYSRSNEMQSSPSTSAHSSERSVQASRSNAHQENSVNRRDRLIGSTQPVKITPDPKRNESTITRKIPNSALSKNSPVVQATVAARQHSSGKGATNSMDAIKEKMESYLNACNDKIQKKSERSPHASFLSYLGSKMDSIPKEKVPAI